MNKYTYINLLHIIIIGPVFLYILVNYNNETKAPDYLIKIALMITVYGIIYHIIRLAQSNGFNIPYF